MECRKIIYHGIKHKATVDFANGLRRIHCNPTTLVTVCCSLLYFNWYLQLHNSKAYSNVKHCDKGTET